MFQNGPVLQSGSYPYRLDCCPSEKLAIKYGC